MIGRFGELFPVPRVLIGVVHLPPLPGSPRGGAPLAEIVHQATRDARTLAEAGFDGIIVENFGDDPFYPDHVPPLTVAAMTTCALAVVEATLAVPRPPRVGINVLRNDAEAALAVAVAAGAAFIRVNVLTGAAVTDQGLIQGCAHTLLRQRRALGREDIAILADVLVKHASPLAPVGLADTARDTWFRGGADALILSGSGTGHPTDPQALVTARAAAPGAPLLVGSGATVETLPALFATADGIIVGTATKEGGQVHRPVDATRAARLVSAREEAP